ncbi:MAG TPA: Fe2+-dependent dioxygenase [Caulobacteraceae bacterium]|nr:Fe2+-dependent dioxygenase [Caulobacteraceae bacterium]
MFLEVPDLLTAAEVDRLSALAAGARFADGRLSNPHSTAKKNLQIEYADAAYAESARLLTGALNRSETLRDFAFPRALAPPMMTKYGPGMSYGLHADAAFLPLAPRPLRSDLSCTVFIAAPSAYEGGELCVQLGTRRMAFKGPPGSAVVYPSNTLHEVKPVTSGERIVGLTFIESRISDQSHRELLYELNEIAALEGLNMSWDNRTRLQCARNNLFRMWAEAG